MANSFYYVLVLTEEGGVFVTDTNGKNVEYDMEKTPKSFTKGMAEDIRFGLTLSVMLPTYVIVSPFALTSQPFKYDQGCFTWVSKPKKGGEE